MRGYDAWRTASPYDYVDNSEPPELGERTHHKPCGGEVRYHRWDGDWWLRCECCGGMPQVLIQESELYDPREHGCHKCGGYSPASETCVACGGSDAVEEGKRANGR